MSGGLRSPVRRRLLQGGVTLVVAFRIGGDAAAQTAAPWQPNAWLAIKPDGAVHVTIVFTEMGQGTETGVAMIVADEMDADWSRVTVSTALPDGKRFMITGGSYSISSAWEPARKAGAQARAMLLHAGRRDGAGPQRRAAHRHWRAGVALHCGSPGQRRVRRHRQAAAQPAVRACSVPGARRPP